MAAKTRELTAYGARKKKFLRRDFGDLEVQVGVRDETSPIAVLGITDFGNNWEERARDRISVRIWSGRSANYSDRPIGRAVTRSLWSGRSEVQISGRLNPTQCCQWLATAATFSSKGTVLSGRKMRRWAPQTCYTLQRNTASIMKNLVDLI